MQGGQKPCANWQLVWVWARRTIKIAYCFDVVSNTLRSEARLNSLSVGGPWPGVVLIHHMPGWDEWIKARKEKASERRVCWRGGPSGSGGYLSLESGCTLKDSRVSCLLIFLSSSSAPASLSRSINPISGRICSWVSSM